LTLNEGDFSELMIESKKVYRVPGFTSWPSSRGGVALDLGINLGTFSLAFAESFDRIVGVDASSACIRIAQKRLAKEGVDNVEFIHAALAGTSGDTASLRRVYVGDDYSAKDFSTLNITDGELANTDYAGRFREVEEEVATLAWADLVERVGADKIRFVKCDIEGSESSLLMGADLRNVECLALELHYTFLGQDGTRELLAHLRRTHRVLGVRSASHLRSGRWPPPSIIWLLNRSVALPRTLLLNALSFHRVPS